MVIVSSFVILCINYHGFWFKMFSKTSPKILPSQSFNEDTTQDNKIVIFFLIFKMKFTFLICSFNIVNLFFCPQWHSLDKGEQAKYYEMAQKEKDLHMQLYPGWSARDNYGMQSKKKRRRKPGDGAGTDEGNM